MEYINIVREPRIVSSSKWAKSSGYVLGGADARKVAEYLTRESDKLALSGFPIVTVDFITDEESETVKAVFTGKRLEGPEELAERVRIQENHNRAVARECEEQKAAIERKKEITRLTKGLTIEELRKAVLILRDTGPTGAPPLE